MNRIKQPTDYLALPPSGKGPGVLVLHAWWGMTDVIRDVCDRLAALGFVAHAPDLYHGQRATTIEEAEHLARALDVVGASEELHEAVELLEMYAVEQNPGIGVIGFSLGAAYALQLSGENPERVKAVVVFYGAGDGNFARAKANYLGHFAENDPYEPAESVAWLSNALSSAGRSATIYRYDGVGHWFFEQDRADAYNEAAANLAWERTVAFLRDNLS